MEIVPVVIIDYNTAERTKKFIMDISKAVSDVELRFVVVDNSCSEFNFGMLQDALNVKNKNSNDQRIYCNSSQKIICVNSGDNLGFAKGNNLGFEVAKRFWMFDYILFSNNDIQIDKIEIQKLILPMKLNTDVAVVGPNVIGLDGKMQSPYGYRNIVDRWWLPNLLFPLDKICKPLNEISNRSLDIEPSIISKRVYRLIGAFILCDVKKFEEVEKFDEETFLYAEEMVLAEKLNHAGYSMYYVSEMKIIHEGGFTTKKQMDSLKKKRKRLKSELYYYSKYRNIPTFIICITRLLFEIYCAKFKIAKFCIRE